MTASLADILFAVKNVAQAINDAARTYLAVQGMQTACGLTAETLIVKGSGRIASVAIINGSGPTSIIYDAAAIGARTNPLCFVSGTLGTYVINLPFNNGLLFVPGGTETVTVSYSTGTGTGISGSS